VSTSAGVRGARRACDDAEPSAYQSTWLYAITRSLGKAGLSGLRGIGGGQIRTLQGGPLTAVVESVDPAVFSADRLQDRLSDPAELEAVARDHHDVVVAVAALGPAIPLRLATVYLTDDRVQDLLSQRRDEFCQTLGWLAHRTECGIKAWAAPDILTSDVAPARQPAASQSGAAYLLRRRAELAARADRQRLAARCGEEIHAALGQLAIASRLHPIHDAGAPADAALQVLNAAYLVESASFQEFAESARAVGTHAGAARVVVTGPWPSYSFADGPDARK
jgi:Gas vesicle synthesis protein GvpL/GvpF